MATMKKLLAMLTALVMLLSMAGASLAEATPEETTETPLVAGYSNFSQKFSPFFADTAYDQDVVKAVLTEGLATLDRTGAVVYNAIEGETISYNGVDYLYTGVADITVVRDEATDTTVYTAKLRDDVRFSDGEYMDADDLIFTYYVYLDPAYVGSATLNSYDIVGLKDYQTQTTSDIYAKYETMANAILAAGADHAWAEGDAWTSEQQDAFWALLKKAWSDDCQDIVNYVVANYNSDDYAPVIGSTVADIAANEGLQMAFGMAMWGFAEYADGVLTAPNAGLSFDLANGVYPTIEDYYAEAYAKYKGDPVAFYSVEAADAAAASTFATAMSVFISAEGAKEPEMAGGVPNIAGIKKIDQHTVSVTLNGFEAPAVYNIMGVQVAPMHYYGDEAQYNYDNNQFGHPFGDLTIVQSKTTQPMGYGPYKFDRYENRIVYFEANEYYYKGAPKTKYMQWRETLDADKISGVATGTIDLSDPSFSNAAIAEIKSNNQNGELDGDKIVVNTVNNLGYGYIGLNADTMLVGGEPASDQSKALRKAFATILSVYRDVAIDSFYGERASVINYPISNTSWAAPQSTDEDYRVAYSLGLDGQPIYTADMNAEQRYAAAQAAAIEYLKFAGYTFDEATGKFTAAPEGALMEYEMLIPADGIGDHPSFGIATDAKAAFETIGITLTINDPADSNVLWDKLDAGTQNIWCAAWGSTPDPDMYQVYHSSGIVGRNGSDSNHYHIDDPTLDQLIVDARSSADQAYRKATYKACLDIILDWGVEIPTYQRQNCIIFSPERINLDTLTPEITTYWVWINDLERLEMK